MPARAWFDNPSINVPEIDAHHRRLIELLHQVHTAMDEGQTYAVLGPLLAGLIQCTRSHFAAEERVLREAQYWDLAHHQAEHSQLIHHIMDLKNRCDQGAQRVTVAALTQLEWRLATHIAGSDRKYAPIVPASSITQ